LRKGQIISSDFIISIAIFLIMISIIIPLFRDMTINRQNSEFREELQTRLSLVSDMLVKTDGIPENWNRSSVTRIGLANDNHRINKTKIRNLVLMDPSTVKDYLALGGIEFNISFRKGDYHSLTGVAESPAAYFYVNERKMISLINNSGLYWDLYYGGAQPPDQADWQNAYIGEKSSVFNLMLQNSSAYRTIIIESPELAQEQVNINSLKDFVSKGGILIFEGNADLISSGFSMHSGGSTNPSGLIKNTERFDTLYDTQVNMTGSLLYFYHADGDSVLKTDIEDKDAPSRALAGYWSHGIGEVYYIADISGSTVSGPVYTTENIIGKKAETSSGPMQNIFSFTRPIVFDSDLNSLGSMTMVIGK